VYARPSAIDRCFQAEPILRGTSKIPRQFIWISPDLLQIPEFVLLPLMPQNRFAEDQPEAQLPNVPRQEFSPISLLPIGKWSKGSRERILLFVS
jgi:hypothetical protein